MIEPDQTALDHILTAIQNQQDPFSILTTFEAEFNPYSPESGPVPLRILGFGEISLVFEIQTPTLAGIALKRLPIFDTESEADRHIAAHYRYIDILRDPLHIMIPPSQAFRMKLSADSPQFAIYCLQTKLPAECFGNHLLQTLSPQGLEQFITAILQALKRVWLLPITQPDLGLQVGLDGQISNWAILPCEHRIPDPATDPFELVYLDTSTPMFREHGQEAMEAHLFLKSAPSFLRWMLKSMLHEVIGRYYDLRSVLIDLIANLYKEQRADLIPSMIALINAFLAQNLPDLSITPLRQEEIRKYYKHDRFIWVLFQSLRKLDRFLKIKILHRSYVFYLPGKIHR